MESIAYQIVCHFNFHTDFSLDKGSIRAYSACRNNNYALNNIIMNICVPRFALKPHNN